MIQALIPECSTSRLERVTDRRRAKEHTLGCFTSSKLCNLIVKQHGARQRAVRSGRAGAYLGEVTLTPSGALVRADSRERPAPFLIGGQCQHMNTPKSPARARAISTAARAPRYATRWRVVRHP